MLFMKKLEKYKCKLITKYFRYKNLINLGNIFLTYAIKKACKLLIIAKPKQCNL